MKPYVIPQEVLTQLKARDPVVAARPAYQAMVALGQTPKNAASLLNIDQKKLAK